MADGQETCDDDVMGRRAPEVRPNPRDRDVSERLWVHVLSHEPDPASLK